MAPPAVQSSAANSRSVRSRNATRHKTTEHAVQDAHMADCCTEGPKRVLRQRRGTDFTSFFDDDSETEEYVKRPSRILRTSTIKKADHAKYNRNAQKSRLLSLPSEIRNRLWTYAFGGCLVHVWFDQDKKDYDTDSDDDDDDNTTESSDELDTGGPFYLWRSVCLAETRDEEEAVKIKESQTDAHSSWSERHRACNHAETYEYKVNSRNIMILDALRTCRQIHSEAALLPYQENTFQSPNDSSLYIFVAWLIPAQRRAIQSISVCCSSTWDVDEWMEAYLKKNLAKIKLLTVHTDFDDHDEFTSDGDGVADTLRIFQRLDIGTVNVAAYITSRKVYNVQKDKNKKGRDRAQLDAWSTSLEDMLMKKYVAEKKEKKTTKVNGTKRKNESEVEGQDW